MRQKGIEVVGVRGLAKHFGGTFFETPFDAGVWMKRHLHEGDIVLLKASRGVKLEESLAELGLDETVPNRRITIHL